MVKSRCVHLYDKNNFMDTLCGKLSPKRGEKLNITKIPKEVTCGGCLRNTRFPTKKIHDLKELRKKYEK